MAQDVLQAGKEIAERCVPDCWQRFESARIGSFLYVLKLPIGPWSDEHSSGGCRIVI